jgi:hypothetical protein
LLLQKAESGAVAALGLVLEFDKIAALKGQMSTYEREEKAEIGSMKSSVHKVTMWLVRPKDSASGSVERAETQY